MIQTLFDGRPPPRLTVEQYKTLFRSLYPLDAPLAGFSYSCSCAAQPPTTSDAPAAPASQNSPGGGGGGGGGWPGTSGSSGISSGTSSGTSEPPTEPDLDELASLLHDAYDATDDHMNEMMPTGPPLAAGDSNMAASIPLKEAAMMDADAIGGVGDARTTGGDTETAGGDTDIPGDTETPGGDAEMPGDTETIGGDTEAVGGDAKLPEGDTETPGGDAEAESLPDVEVNLSLELPSLEVSHRAGDVTRNQ